MITTSIIGEHARRNASTRGRWDAMASHRARIMSLIEESRGENGRTLCLLGPGNGNDIDLARLAGDYEKIALIDLDEAALARAVAALDEKQSERVLRYCPVDLSGILPALESWVRNRNPTEEQISTVKRSVVAAPRPDVGTFDVVASTCMLTQLIDSVYMALPTEHPRCVQLVTAVCNRHLEIILELLTPGGRGLLVTDFVATQTVPELAQLDELLLPQAATKWIEERNFFTGANPFAIRDYYSRSREPGPCAADVRVNGPWRWDIGDRQLAVCAVTFRRTGGRPD
jgi:hypothetical protein